MALGPKQMGDAIVRNLQAKTGKTLEEWIRVVSETGLREKKEVVNYLKTTHGVGHFQAQTIYEHFIGEIPYDDPDRLVEELFRGEQIRQLFLALKDKIEQMGSDVRAQPCKTYVPFYRRSTFSVLVPEGEDQVAVGLVLPEDFESPVWSRAAMKQSERITHLAVLGSEEDLNEEVASAIEMAYRNN